MGFANRAIVAGCVGLAASALVGCGSSGSGLLTPNQASSLNSQLDQVSRAVASGQCDTAQNAVQSFENSVASLDSVNQTLVNNLNEGATVVGTLAAKDCAGANPTTTTTATTTTTKKTHTTTTSTATTATTTTPTTTATTPATTPGTTSTPATTTPGSGTTTTPATGGVSPGGGGTSGTGTGTGGGAGVGGQNQNGQ